MKKEISEGNKLIAEFMGWNQDSQGFWIGCPKAAHFKLTFDTSWDELMPVVIKISVMPFPRDKGWKQEDYDEMMAYPYPRTFGMRNKEGQFMVRLNANGLFEADTLIEATWLAVVDFIKWYNQNKTS